jgi:hypothetical protein
MTDLLELKPDDVVLEIGTGLGYPLFLEIVCVHETPHSSDTCPFRKFHPTAALNTCHGRFPKIPRPAFGDPTPGPG